ncbi:acyltransferase family protein [Planococcus salinus]|uniref:Acyltransferase 3 domain-containing protein n=1 Tax=Planococcus salinus TaxID=1848460 RepID=A0A3M8P4C4_9BACL|nr:acyltransferase family protein [Planococcus salinus]RNF38251.1 hypothetical protein EEX84_15430 [Planococcus salinus]
MKNLSEINMIRAFACLSVVYNHVITNFDKFTANDFSETAAFTVLRYLFLFATPVFILISITLLSRNYPEKLPERFLWKRLKFIFVPYVLIGLFTAYIASVNSEESGFREIAWKIVALGDWHGFFILVIFQFYLLFWLFNKLLRKIKPWMPLLVTFVISFGHLYAMEHVLAYQEFIYTEYPLWYRTNILAWLFYFVAGFYIGVHYERLVAFLVNKWWLLLVVAAGSFAWVYHNVVTVGYTDVASDRYDMFLYTLSVFFLLVVLFRKMTFRMPLLEIVSSFSFFIYLSHLLFMVGLGRITQVFQDSFLLYSLTLLLFVTGISVGIGILLYTNRVTRLVTGKNAWMDRLMRPVVSESK